MSVESSGLLSIWDNEHENWSNTPKELIMTVCRNCDELLDADAESERQLLYPEMN